MTETNDARVRELISELVDASPVAPPFYELTTRRLHRRKSRRIGTTVAIIAVMIAVFGVALAGVAILRRDRRTQGPSAHVRVETPRPHAAARYVDPAKPPPLRIIAGAQYVDVSTVLGCWLHTPGDAAGHGVGMCATGVVDPSRFRLSVSPGQRIELRLPIEADLSAFLGDASAPPQPGALATPVTDKHAVPLRHEGAGTWSFLFAGADHDLALLVDIRANTSTNNVRVSGDANYGATLVTP